LAAKRGKRDVLQKVWDWAKNYLTTEEIINNLLLATDNNVYTACHLAAKGGEQHAFKKIWELAKENLTKHEIK
jgi:endo-1,4-beta-D-glucanase Y